jgi:hypothetical protein
MRGEEGGMETQIELDAAAAAELEMNYMTMSKLKDDRIKRLEEMLADAHECLEKGLGFITAKSASSRPSSTAGMLWKAGCWNGSMAATWRGPPTSERDADRAHDGGYDNLQSHFRNETLKMCQEIVELQMQIRFLEVEPLMCA